MKILINTPNWRRPELGGVANHYYGLRPFWTESVRYNIVGSRVHKNTGKYWLPWDLIKTAIKLLFYNPQVLVVNTSLGANALRRDSIFLNMAKAFGKKTIVHFHGFDINYAQNINVSWFLKLFRHADGFLVLSTAIKKQLEDWGVKQPILLTTTKVDDRMVSTYDRVVRNGEINNILYLGRIEREKGIYLFLDICCELSKKYNDLRYTVVGGGSELEKSVEYAKKKNLENIQFTGVLSGEALVEQFEKADLYLFTSFHEGMPTSVLEAMCFGLPIVTRPVGGLVDFFENEKMGQMIDSFNPEDFIAPIEYLLKNETTVKNISQYNHQYGMTHFLASKVAFNIEQKIRELC